ncbi:hypothetical protein KUCAC02_010233 [Chaenocephalus aceratus]|uniref:Uncharacterized protein n=1 Tax=Chaenocephalus aceratus TaxID=36190 RepID=A0ACB9VYL8_CHAAC|nr:hypothetical protein KUCAC02_010233 [Chaenocephalus aceratus]
MIIKEDMEGMHEVKKCRLDVRDFYVNVLAYMAKKFLFKDNLICNAVVVDPAVRQNLSMRSFLKLLDELPTSAVPIDKQDAVCVEFMQYQSAKDTELPPYTEGERVDAFWAAMAKLRDPATSQPCYENVCTVAQHVLLVPHSNAYYEALFSMVCKITTDQRSQLGRGKEGHSKSSVYSETYGIRNTLCGLLAGKINIFEKCTCCNWRPDPELLKKAKSASYQALK